VQEKCRKTTGFQINFFKKWRHGFADAKSAVMQRGVIPAREIYFTVSRRICAAQGGRPAEEGRLRRLMFEGKSGARD
jgi:hypothetical protein